MNESHAPVIVVAKVVHDMISGGLEAGATLAHYRVIAQLGAGGMGVVYLAADEHLKRNVALKILPDEVVNDESRLRRFKQEAQTASALNHPSIVTIYEIGTIECGGKERHFIAMELIEGRTLRELQPSRANLKKLLPPFIDVADGLSKAHAAGIIHRDLKPENIMITADGRAKIVDFGLAKLVPCEVQLSPDAPTAVLETGTGMVMGTVGYMSPEQVEARVADHRSDIFSLGCVLYEAVGGARAFRGTSAVDTLHQILHADPAPLHELNPAAPPDLIRVVHRCLAKDPDERFQSVKEVAIELRAILRDQIHDSAAVKPLFLKRQPRGLWKVALFAALVASALTAAAILLLPRQQPALSSYRFTPLETTPGYEGFPAWSPNGKTIAYVAEVDGVLQVFTRSLTSSQRTRITSQQRDCREPFWSPDGSRIYFISVAGNKDALWVVGAAGGSPEVVLRDVSSAAISPDGKRLALLRQTNEQGEFNLTLEFADGEGGKAQRFEHPDFVDQYITTGSIRFSPDGTKLGAWLYLGAVGVGGAAGNTGATRGFFEISIPAMQPRRRLEVLTSIPRSYPFSWLPDSRHIVFGGQVPGELGGTHLWLADTVSNRLEAVTATPGNEAYPSVSPDGKRIVFTTEDADFDLLEIPLNGSPVKPLLASSRVERIPVWAPDGGSFAFVSNRSGVEEVWLRSVKGDFERPIVSRGDFDDGLALIASLALSPDGQRIAYQRSGGNFRIWISSVAGGAPVLLNGKEFAYEDHPTWSPDGEWIAFVGYSEEGRRSRTFPKLMRKRVGLDDPPAVIAENVISAGGLKWSPTGEWIAYETAEGMTLVSPDGAKKRLLVEDSWHAFAWSKDGKTLYAIRSDEGLRIAAVRIDVGTGEERIVADLGIAPPTDHPFQGLSVAPDEKSMATSVVRLRGDLWIFEGWPAPRASLALP